MEEKKVNINLDPQIAGGSYSNLAIISHTKSEFVLDFASTLPGMPGPKVNSRIIMTPEHAKRLLGALAENMGKYESHFGPVDLSDGQGATLNLGDLMQGGGAKS
ncbi:MAG: DUF3467 domain-containing protein [Bacteroidales bacterium]|nr:DUF3467 domain-containing protein [Bacteroidales bacterium]